MSDDTRVEVLPVPEGSIVWLHNVAFPPDEDDEEYPNTMAHDLLERLRRATGHDQFVVLCTEGGAVVEVLGPDEIVARVRAALDVT